MDAIDIFLNEWIELATKWHLNEVQRLTRWEQDNRDASSQYDHALARKEEFTGITREIYDYYRFNAEERIRELMVKEAKSKKSNLIARVEAKVGEITDASGLRVTGNGELDGFIIGVNGRVSVETISAGGYNIQCFHYRTKVKEC